MTIASKSFGDIITFTRASTGTYVNSTGLIASAAIDAPRFDYDPVTLAAKGFLIEEQRTNLLLYSEQLQDASWGKSNASIGADVTASPSGVVNADKLIENTASAAHFTNKTVSFTTGTAYTFSVYVKGAERTSIRILLGSGAFGVDQSVVFNLTNTTISVISGTSVNTIQACGNGWFRCVVTATTTATASATIQMALVDTGTNVTYTGDGVSGLYVWGAQLEAALFATSYIPTTTAAATRSADVASVNTLSPWYNASEGTLFVSYIERAKSASHQLVYVSDGTANNRIVINVNNSNVLDGQIVVGGTDSFSGNTPTLTNQAYKVALAYKENDSGISANGSEVTTDTGVAIPTGMSSMKIGASVSGAQFVNSTISRISYYSRRFSNAELQALSA